MRDDALLFALAPGVWVLCLDLFFLRLTGQGMLSHAAAATMARLDATVRGRALSIAQLGHPAGQVIFPALVVTAIALVGWRSTWLRAAVVAGRRKEIAQSKKVGNLLLLTMHSHGKCSR